MDWLIGIGGCVGVVFLAAVLVSLFHLFSRGVNLAYDCVRKRYGKWLERRRPTREVLTATPQPLKLRRFSRSKPTALEAIAELLWFAEEKQQRGEIIFWDDLPTIRNSQGLECVVIVRTIHFLAFLGNAEELRRRNAIVLEVPQPIA
jgi:hypothetical protein